MTYTAMDVANHVLAYCTSKKRPISNLKLQKLMYFLWVDYYKRTSEHLYEDEICAWQLGPVVPAVYYQYSSHAGNPIIANDMSVLTDEDQSLINTFTDQYIDVPASILVDKTHESGTPWDVIFENGAGNRRTIPFELIKILE